MYIEHPYKYDGKYYANVDGKMIEITKEVAYAMNNFYRSSQPRKVEIKNEKGEVVCLYVQSFKTAKLVAVRADENLELILPKGLDQYGGHRLATSDNLDIQRKSLN